MRGVSFRCGPEVLTDAGRATRMASLLSPGPLPFGTGRFYEAAL
jgi:hypothetical protein